MSNSLESGTMETVKNWNLPIYSRTKESHCWTKCSRIICLQRKKRASTLSMSCTRKALRDTQKTEGDEWILLNKSNILFPCNENKLQYFWEILRKMENEAKEIWRKLKKIWDIRKNAGIEGYYYGKPLENGGFSRKIIKIMKNKGKIMKNKKKIMKNGEKSWRIRKRPVKSHIKRFCPKKMLKIMNSQQMPKKAPSWNNE